MALLITLALLVNLGVFVCYPMSGPMGFTFLYISAVLWTALAFLIGHSTARLALLPRVVITIIFALGCAFSGLSFLPQADKVPAVKKFANGAYPDKRSVYLGLLRLGISVQALRPPQQPEAEVI